MSNNLAKGVDIGGTRTNGIFFSVPAILLLSGETLLFTNPTAFFKGIGLNTWFLFSLAAIVCWGVFSACQKITTNYISAEWSYASFVITSVIITIAFLVAEKLEFHVRSKIFSLGAVAGIVNGLGVLASFAAYRAEGNAAAVTTIAGALQPVFSIVLVLIFLDESLSMIEIMGIVLAILGALLLSFEPQKPKLETA